MSEMVAANMQKAQKMIALTGWQFEEVTVNQVTGYACIKVARIDGNDKRLVTLMRSSHGGKVVERREVGRLRQGMYKDWWDFSESHLLGCATREGFRSALRSLANYIDDNKAIGCLESSRPALRLIADMDQALVEVAP
jgi:hypothetical protein